jgi:hypothetical protein
VFAFPVGWGLSSALASIAVVQQDAQRFSTLDILLRNPLVDFVYTNGISLNLLGMIPLTQWIRCGTTRQKTMVVALFLPLILMSVLLLILHSAQTGPSWRMIAVWGELLIPFTAHFLAPATGFGGQSKALLAATLLVCVAFWHEAFSIESASAWAFPPSDMRTGQYLNRILMDAPDTRILIESSRSSS